jgi:rfaE bifunctional protein nucleotidyltransferase chain/domain
LKALETINNKIVDREQLPWILNRWKLKDEKVVFTNGCFDLLHQGHIDYLAKAADLGSKLIVGVNTDNSVRGLGKGENRPIQDERSRAIIMAALHFVSLVVLFDEATPLRLIELIKPHVLVKGSDYTVENIVGHEVVLKHGGEVKTIDFLDGFSTSSIIEKARKN